MLKVDFSTRVERMMLSALMYRINICGSRLSFDNRHDDAHARADHVEREVFQAGQEGVALLAEDVNDEFLSSHADGDDAPWMIVAPLRWGMPVDSPRCGKHLKTPASGILRTTPPIRVPSKIGRIRRS